MRWRLLSPGTPEMLVPNRPHPPTRRESTLAAAQPGQIERGAPVDTAAELESIRRLKYAYFRTLDLKQFDDLGALLTEDVHRGLRGRQDRARGPHAPSSRGSARGPGRPRHGDRCTTAITPRSPSPRDTTADGHLVPAGPRHHAGGRPRDRRHGVLRRPLPADRRGLAHRTHRAIPGSSRSTAPTPRSQVRSFRSRFDAPG